MIELLLQAERLLSVGLLDKAEQLYRQVANADPKNSIAVVGLARVTLDRGDDEGALELARRAVAIDPENAAAQRLVARLEEVLEYRQSAESLLFDRAEAVSALQAEVAAEVAAEVGAVPADDIAPGVGEVAEKTAATAEVTATGDATGATAASDAPLVPSEEPVSAAPAAPAAATGAIDAADVAPDPTGVPAPAPAHAEPPPPPGRVEPGPSSMPVPPLAATPADAPNPPWADVKVPEPEPAPPPPAVEPQVPYIPPSTSATAGVDGATAQTGILGYLERLFRRR